MSEKKREAPAISKQQWQEKYEQAKTHTADNMKAVAVAHEEVNKLWKAFEEAPRDRKNMAAYQSAKKAYEDAKKTRDELVVALKASTAQLNALNASPNPAPVSSDQPTTKPGPVAASAQASVQASAQKPPLTAWQKFAKFMLGDRDKSIKKVAAQAPVQASAQKPPLTAWQKFAKFMLGDGDKGVKKVAASAPKAVKKESPGIFSRIISGIANALAYIKAAFEKLLKLILGETDKRASKVVASEPKPVKAAEPAKNKQVDRQESPGIFKRTISKLGKIGNSISEGMSALWKRAKSIKINPYGKPKNAASSSSTARPATAPPAAVPALNSAKSATNNMDSTYASGKSNTTSFYRDSIKALDASVKEMQGTVAKLATSVDVGAQANVSKAAETARPANVSPAVAPVDQVDHVKGFYSKQAEMAQMDAAAKGPTVRVVENDSFLAAVTRNAFLTNLAAKFNKRNDAQAQQQEEVGVEMSVIRPKP